MIFYYHELTYKLYKHNIFIIIIQNAIQPTPSHLSKAKSVTYCPYILNKKTTQVDSYLINEMWFSNVGKMQKSNHIQTRLSE